MIIYHMEVSRDQKITLALKTQSEDLVTKADLAAIDLTTKVDLAIIGLAHKEDIAKGSAKFIRWMFILSVAQVVITALAVHFWMK
jgi:hypothetical protein